MALCLPICSTTTAKKTARVLSAWLTATGFLAVAPQAAANEKVYRVEMIVFERHATSGGGDTEGWQKNILLQYPANWQRLIDPTEEAARQAQAAQEGSLRLSDDFLQTLADERGDDSNAPAQGATEGATDTTGPKYFEYLPPEARNLRKTHDALVRRNLYRVLFHETWIQPLGALEKSPALILHGGKRYGDHHELQGYIHLGVSRFLHVHTDLWLSEFSINHGQDDGLWPQLPLEPHLAPAEDTNVEYSDLKENTDMVNLTTRRNHSEWGNGSSDWNETKESLYLVNNISTLRQKRRLRSGELHYLDHPRFGVLVKITPH